MSDINKNENYPLTDLTYKIIKCANDVHKQIGSGFHEVVYKQPLAIEFILQNLPFERELEIPFKNGEKVETRCVDFFVDGKVSVELKSIFQFEDEHLTRTLNYLEANNMETGLLINFGGQCLDVKRVTNQKYQN